MKREVTEIVFILDRSGSMSGLEKDTIGSYNSFLESQRKIEAKAIVTTILFDDQYEIIHDRQDLDKLKPLKDEDYFVRGMTALLDAIGMTISMIDMKQAEDGADKIIFVIITDGYENASREFDYQTLKRLVEEKKSQGWEFIFLGANMDVAEEAEKFGIEANRTMEFVADKEGMISNFKIMNNLVTEYRKNVCLAPERIEKILKKEE